MAGVEARKRNRDDAFGSGGADDDDGGEASPSLPSAKRVAAPPTPACTAVAPGSELAGLSATEAEARAAQARAQVSRLRDAYGTLSSPTAQPRDVDAAYGALLSATGGCASAQRLAAAFLPQFAARVPAQLDAAVAALTTLLDAPDTHAAAQPSLAAAAREAAAHGLAALAATAATSQGAESKAAKAAAAALLRRVALCSDEAAAAALSAAFAAAPQGVLAALMMSFVARDDAQLRAGAREWADSALSADSLAAALAKAPNTAAWFGAAARAFRGGAPPALVQEAWPTIEAVLRAAGDTAGAALPPPPVLPPPPPPPPHGARDRERHGERRQRSRSPRRDGGAGGHAAAPAHLHRQPLPPPPPLPPSMWRGQLRKSGAPVADIVCMPAGPPPPEGEAPEPLAWPHVLDVLQRAETAHVVGPLLRGAPPRGRALRRVALAAPHDAAAAAELRAFAEYLAQRSRSGVVKLPAASGSGGAMSAPARLLYLIPHAPGVAAALGARDDPQAAPPALWALVLPADRQ